MEEKMKIITTKEPVMGIVEYKDKITYKTEDGQEFSNEISAINHEEKLNKRKNFAKKYKLDHIELGGEFYDAIFITELTKETETEIAKYYSRKIYHLSEGWNLIHIDDSGDHFCINRYDPIEILRCMEEEIQNLKNLLNK